MRYHIVVTGSLPNKNAEGKYLPFAQENVDFINATLDKLTPSDYVFLYTNMTAGTGTIAYNWALAHNVEIRQFPAYWFDPSKADNKNMQAGYQAGEQMVRHAKQAVYNKPEETLIVLAFHSTETLDEDKPVSAVVKFATERNNLTTKVFALPVKKATAPAVTPTAAPPADTTANPFG